jgi:hypothetical protein
VSEIPLPPGRRREVWRYRPTGNEYAVQVDEATGRIEYAHQRTGGGGGLTLGGGIDALNELRLWLHERRDQCDVLRLEERVGVISGVAGTAVSVTFDDGNEMTTPVAEIWGVDLLRAKVGVPIVAIYIGDRMPVLARDSRPPRKRFPYPRLKQPGGGA